jgi:hypothetical protein
VRFEAPDQYVVKIIHLTLTGKPGGDGWWFQVTHCGAIVAMVRTPSEVGLHVDLSQLVQVPE